MSVKELKKTKDIDLQQVGTYYSVPIKDIFEEKRKEFDFENLDDYILLNKYSIDSGEYVENYNNINYEYTDELEIDYYFHQLMNYKKYNHYLVVLFNSRWNGASGYKIFNNYMDCFCRDYDNTMYVKGSSKMGKYLKLREYHHDNPMGHDSIIIGLTDREYEKLDNMNIEQIIDFATKSLLKVKNFD